MLKALRDYDPKIAAGILAEAALHLEGQTRGTPQPLVENQPELERAILNELRDVLNIAPNDLSRQAVELLTQALDCQSDALITVNNPSQGKERLSAEGILPSDAYSVQFENHLEENFGWRWNVERVLAEETIRHPHREQTLEQVDLSNIGALISIFSRFYQHKFPARSFWFLVIGDRRGAVFHVSQVWRVYPSEVDLSNCSTLLDVLKSFAQRFGYEIELNGARGKFFLSALADQVGGYINNVKMSGSTDETMTFTMFYSTDERNRYVALLVPISLTKYFRSVEYWRGWERDIWEQLHSVRALARLERSA